MRKDVTAKCYGGDISVSVNCWKNRKKVRNACARSVAWKYRRKHSWPCLNWMINPSQNIICSWSGGKDSCFALMTAVKQGHKPVALLNVLNENGQISRSHGLPPSILEQQAAALGLPVLLQPSTWQDYETRFVQALRRLKSEHHATAAVFGDIDLQPHRDWEEKVCAAAGMEALLPLWQEERKVLVYRMLEQGLKCRIVSCNTTLGEDFLGREMDDVLIADLEDAGVDVCGENGEFHTVVTDCPLFKVPVQLPLMRKCGMKTTTSCNGNKGIRQAINRKGPDNEPGPFLYSMC